MNLNILTITLECTSSFSIAQNTRELVMLNTNSGILTSEEEKKFMRTGSKKFVRSVRATALP